MNRSFLGSLIIHAVLVTLAWFLLKPQPAPPPPPPAPFSVEVTKLGLPKGQPRGSAPPLQKPKLPSLKDLGVQYSASPSAKARKEQEGDSTESGSSESPYGFESALTQGRAAPLLSYLYQRIDGGIAYPAELRDAKMSGEISATLSFDRHGKWIDNASDIRWDSLESRYFRIYVIRRLREILEEPIPSNLLDPEHLLTIQARFVFERVMPERVIGAQVGPQYAPSADPSRFTDKDTDGGQSIEKQLNQAGSGISGRKFLFRRVVLKSPLEWNLGPLSGYGIMPAVGISPSWFVDTVENMIHHRAPPDPLRRYREDPEW